ncbi:type IX secretion system outer membrane channel protein PorV [Capnocytophaga sp.]|uniref:type IX secretion system outer membrane channel protein PorV n=1 Tax=Capnocytophaga sp. TaxID=44737 RepID=UPI0026DB69F9|nr:type IX secretion system outer membrane channel protein PorV [Capnocytophaga sp.]MDO5105440.1 type IX secretion system outer membrane channel protein PorV [Capnocytophaga sp.]
MRFLRVFVLFLGFYNSVFSQEERPLATAFPFLLLSPDATASGRGDTGVASTPDVFSQYWNASKYVFAPENSGVALGYTPYLSKVVRDVFIGNLCYYKKTHRSAWAGSFRYFSIGDVTLTQGFNNDFYVLGNFRPSEFAFDLSYSLKLSEHYAMGVAARFLSSNLRLPTEESYTARGLGFDISGYYHSPKHLIGNYFGSYRFGFQVSNIGGKVQYENHGHAFFIPTNLRLGISYTLLPDSYNRFELLLEMNKLLIPSPPKYHYTDHNGNGKQDADEPLEIVAGKNPNVDFFQGIFRSFSDAPNGFSEEWHEIAWSAGFEYAFDERFFLRTGYFYQHKNKGDRQYLTIGTGFKIKTLQADFSYLFSTAKTHNPLSSSLRISLQYTF